MTFEQFKNGDRFLTARRTVTESEIMQFVSLVGLFEPLFVDAEYICEQVVTHFQMPTTIR